MTISKKLIQKFNIFFYNILKEFSEKIDTKILKKFADIFFIFYEKIALKFDYFLYLYLKYYEDMIKSEINLISISKSDKVIHVGCGSIPASSILISQKTGANVIGIDKNKKAVMNAKFCINKLNLSDKIEIKNYLASDFLFYDFDVIVISQGIKPVDMFLRYLSKKVSKNSRIILRTFSNKYGNLLKSDEKSTSLFIVKKIIRHKKQGRLISVKLLIKD